MKDDMDIVNVDLITSSHASVSGRRVRGGVRMVITVRDGLVLSVLSS